MGVRHRLLSTLSGIGASCLPGSPACAEAHLAEGGLLLGGELHVSEPEGEGALGDRSGESLEDLAVGAAGLTQLNGAGTELGGRSWVSHGPTVRRASDTATAGSAGQQADGQGRRNLRLASSDAMGSLIKKRRKRMRKKKHKKMLKATRWQRRAGK